MNEIVMAALLSVSQNVYLYTAPGNQGIPYIVYGTDGDNNLFGSNVRAENCDTGYIDLFTNNANDNLIQSIPTSLENHGVSFYLNSVQHENATNILHYEWRWECA